MSPERFLQRFMIQTPGTCPEFNFQNFDFSEGDEHLSNVFLRIDMSEMSTMLSFCAAAMEEFFLFELFLFQKWSQFIINQFCNVFRILLKMEKAFPQVLSLILTITKVMTLERINYWADQAHLRPNPYWRLLSGSVKTWLLSELVHFEPKNPYLRRWSAQ